MRLEMPGPHDSRNQLSFPESMFKAWDEVEMKGATSRVCEALPPRCEILSPS